MRGRRKAASAVSGAVVRVNIYIDGFNLYYGLRRHSRNGIPCKWLDVAALCHRLLPGRTINRIRYFTAPIMPPPWDHPTPAPTPRPTPTQAPAHPGPTPAGGHIAGRRGA